MNSLSLDAKISALGGFRLDFSRASGAVRPQFTHVRT